MNKGIGQKLEWIDGNKYNSFNSYKGLAYINAYRNIARWLKSEAKLLAPIHCSFDPVHLCNFKCGHCNAQRYLALDKDRLPARERLMTRAHMRNLIAFLADWGIKGVCIGGGGEPLLNKGVWDLPSYINGKGMESAFATNGYWVDRAMAKEMMHCRWVGFSIDAGERKTFKHIHGVDAFERVIANLKLLLRKKKETGSKVDICYKMLIRPDNLHSVLPACKLAKAIGVRDFHVRPVDLQRRDFKMKLKPDYNVAWVLEILEACHKLETEDFRVFSVVHKYSPQLRVVHNFKRCIASALAIQCCADGNVYVCMDHRIEKRFKLGRHYPRPENILRFWGSDRHRKLLNSIHVDRECGRCTYGEYARQIEDVVIEDNMCLNFP